MGKRVDEGLTFGKKRQFERLRKYADRIMMACEYEFVYGKGTAYEDPEEHPDYEEVYEEAYEDILSLQLEEEGRKWLRSSRIGESLQAVYAAIHLTNIHRVILKFRRLRFDRGVRSVITAIMEKEEGIIRLRRIYNALRGLSRELANTIPSAAFEETTQHLIEYDILEDVSAVAPAGAFVRSMKVLPKLLSRLTKSLRKHSIAQSLASSGGGSSITEDHVPLVTDLLENLFDRGFIRLMRDFDNAASVFTSEEQIQGLILGVYKEGLREDESFAESTSEDAHERAREEISSRMGDTYTKRDVKDDLFRNGQAYGIMMDKFEMIVNEPFDPNGFEVTFRKMPIYDCIKNMEAMFEFIEDNGSTTPPQNEAGFHVNISIDGLDMSYSTLDLLKLFLFVQEEFTFSKLRRSRWAMDTFRLDAKLLIETARLFNKGSSISKIAKRLNKELIAQRKKTAAMNILSLNWAWVSISPNDEARIEFRTPGGAGYHTESEKLKWHMQRYAYLMVVAFDPAAFRREYLTYLSKFLDQEVKRGQPSVVRMLQGYGVPITPRLSAGGKGGIMIDGFSHLRKLVASIPVGPKFSKTTYPDTYSVDV